MNSSDQPKARALRDGWRESAGAWALTASGRNARLALLG